MIHIATTKVLVGAVIVTSLASFSTLRSSSPFFLRQQSSSDETIFFDHRITQSPLTTSINHIDGSNSKIGPIIQLTAEDFLMADQRWDSSRVVIESHKLIFFTTEKVGCTVWKRLFRRMMGFSDWAAPEVPPHNPDTNGLVYLRDLPLDDANRILNSPDYIRAMFVRDPKERFLSAFLEKSLSQNGTNILNICQRRVKQRMSKDELWKQTRTFEGFVNITRKCHDDHWKAQSLRMESRRVSSPIWNTLDFVGHIESAAADSRRLLERIGAWDEFGQSGWDGAANRAIFETTASVSHKTGAGDHLAEYYTPKLACEIDLRYGQDYELEVLGLERREIIFSDRQ